MELCHLKFRKQNLFVQTFIFEGHLLGNLLSRDLTVRGIFFSVPFHQGPICSGIHVFETNLFKARLSGAHNLKMFSNFYILFYFCLT